MSVLLLRHTPEPERVVALAGRLCYSAATVFDLAGRMEDDEQVGRMIAMLLEMGHTSPLEHVSFTFGIEASRACLNQLVRHRIASYSQQSQRYVRADGFTCVLPGTVAAVPEARQVFDEAAEAARRAYARLLAFGIPKEDARYLLPMGTVSRIVATFNARSLYILFRLRCCERAQWEIRDVAREMLSLVCGVAPRLFARAGPACETEGICPEGEFSCGRLAKMNARKGE